MKKLLLLLPLLLFLPTVKAVTYISDCSVLDTEGETYVLTSDIINTTLWDCMEIEAPNIVLDCSNHLIDADINSDVWGVVVDYDNAVIKNCRLRDCRLGVGVFGNNAVIENSTFFMESFNYDYQFYGVGAFSNNLTVKNSSFINLSWYGIIGGALNLTVRNSYFYNNGIGIWISSNNSLIENSTFISHKFWVSEFIESAGISIEGNSYFNSIRNSYFEDNRHGVRIKDSFNNTIENCSFFNSEDAGVMIINGGNNLINSSNITNSINLGVYLDSYNILMNSRITGCGYFGVYARNFNLIYNNIFNNTNNAYGYGTNYWNVTKRAGNNLWNSSLGYIGGNAWFEPFGSGWSELCADLNDDGFCDTPYVLATDNIDYLPIAKSVGKGGFAEITGCINITKIGNYTLVRDLMNVKDCFNIWSNWVNLNCNGHLIDGTGVGNGISINSSYVRVENCTIKDFENGIIAFNSSSLIFDNNTLFNNTRAISLNAQNLTLNYSKIFSNAYGLVLNGTSDLWVANATVFNNLFNNTNNILINEFVYPTNTDWRRVAFNITKQSGTNILNPSSYYKIGGNAWAFPNGTGYSETCSDSDLDGFCDSLYTILSRGGNVWVDYLPISIRTTLCVRNYPTVEINPSIRTVQRLSSVQYNLSVNNTDWIGCGASNFSIDVFSCPSGGCEICYGSICSSSLEVEFNPLEKKNFIVNITPIYAGNFTFTIRVCSSMCSYASANITVNPIPCVRKPPALAWESALPAKVSVHQGVSLEIRVTNVDEGDCSPSTFNFNYFCPSHVNCSLDRTSLTLSQGSTAWIHLSVEAQEPKDAVLRVRGTNTLDGYYEIEGNLIVYKCKVLEESEVYVMESDAINEPFTVCMDGSNNNWVLDCKGHVIEGNKSYGSIGIDAKGWHFTIKNCIIRNFQYGIYLRTPVSFGNSLIENCTFENNTYGIVFDYIPTNNTVTHSVFIKNYMGVRVMAESRQNKIIYNRFENNTIGIEISKIGAVSLWGPYQNEISRNNFTYNYYGIKMTEGLLNTFYLNILISIHGESITVERVNYWNSELGNYWGKVDGTGYSDTCTDANKDGICDSPYKVGGGTFNIDNFPLSKYYLARPPPPSVCQFCDPASFGYLGIFCMIVNLFFCNPMLLLIVIVALIVFELLRFMKII